jgi:hypothetical protein
VQEKARCVGGARQGESSVDGNVISDMDLAPSEAFISGTPHSSRLNLESSLNTNDGSAVVSCMQSNPKFAGVERGNLKMCDGVRH